MIRATFFFQKVAGFAWVFLCLVIYIGLAFKAADKPNDYKIQDPKFLVPASASLLLSFGDSYLAGNLNYFRTVTVFHYTSRNLEARAVLLKESSKLSPKHVDSMFQSAALPWEGPVDESIYSLLNYKNGRYWDWMPVFMLGLTESNFKSNHEQAGEYIAEAAERAKGQKNYAYLKTAASNMYTKGDNLEASLNYVIGLKNSVKQDRLKFLLGIREDSLRTLIELRELAKRRRDDGFPPLISLEQLVDDGYIEILPEDPLGVSFGVNARGIPHYHRGFKK